MKRGFAALIIVGIVAAITVFVISKAPLSGGVNLAQ